MEKDLPQENHGIHMIKEKSNKDFTDLKDFVAYKQECWYD